MIDVFFAFVLLALAGAVVLLFAMFGELTARLPGLSVDYRDPTVSPLEEARLGSSPDHWPEPLASLVAEGGGSALLLILSTACGSCESVARQLAEENGASASSRTGVVVSCADRRVGEDFVRRHGLGRMPIYVDEDGAWVTSSFGVQTSPTGLAIRNGRLQSATVFTDVAALRAAATPDLEEVMA